MVYSEVVQKLITSINSRHTARLSAVKILTASHGKCDIEVKIRREHSNVMGDAHNGFMATLVDVASASALRTHSKLLFDGNKSSSLLPEINFVTSNMHLTYLRPIKIGEEIIAKANTVSIGLAIAEVDLTVFDKNTDEICLKASTKFAGRF